MKLKKFILMNLIISLVLISSVYFISKFVKDYSKEDILRFKKYLSLGEKTVKVVNIGSSHGKYAFYYLTDDLKKINLARNSQSFYYDLQLLKKYSNKIKLDSVIVIPISIFSFYNQKDKELDEGYIQLLDKKNILNINFKEYFLIKNFSVLYPPSNILKLKENLKYKEYQVKYPNNLKLNDKIEESKKTGLRHLGISDIKYSIKNAEEDFINLINYIESKNWKYVLITTPFSYLYNENIEKYQKGAFKERIYDNIKKVEKRLEKKFIYLDYSHDSRFENNLEYFFDDDHLNEKGAKYFTEILLEDLKKLGYNID